MYVTELTTADEFCKVCKIELPLELVAPVIPAPFEAVQANVVPVTVEPKLMEACVLLQIVSLLTKVNDPTGVGFTIIVAVAGEPAQLAPELVVAIAEKVTVMFALVEFVMFVKTGILLVPFVGVIFPIPAGTVVLHAKVTFDVVEVKLIACEFVP